MNKISIISYEASHNLGDYIQTLAVKQHFRTNLIEVNREKLHEKPKEKSNLLINGWFMENPSHWPPHGDYNPLFISFHLNPTAKETMLTDSGVAYLKKHEPIGCRDDYTVLLLQSRGIKAYFSACLTLTFQRKVLLGRSAISQHGILVLSAFERLEQMGKPLGKSGESLLQKVKIIWNLRRYQTANKRLERFLARSKKPVRYLSQILDDPSTPEDDRWKAAQNQLLAIASAQLVITSRIHSALPAVALGVPVLFLKDGLEHPNQNSRLEGLSQFFTCCKSRDLKELSWDTIKNPNTHQPFVTLMEEKLANWIKSIR